MKINNNCREFDSALKLLCSEVFGEGENYTLNIEKGERLTVRVTQNGADVTCKDKAQLCRALGHLKAHKNEVGFTVDEAPVFKTLGIMIDCSRNLVVKPDAMKDILRKVAIMGMNFVMLYTEDTYEIEGEPYFGYMRGRFTADEIRDIDDYAYDLGIELVPCIQTLGHFTHILKWDAYTGIKNTLDIMLIDEEKTYEFIEKAIKAATAPYRSKRIHIGLDEADDLAEGVYRKRHGLEDCNKLMKQHVKRVLGITKKLGLEPMMWSDMYFTPTFGRYYETEKELPQDIFDGINRDAQMVFWDYYHDTRDVYDHMFDLHNKIADNTVFAGGVYTWMGLVPDYKKTFDTMVPALYSAKDKNIKEVFATIWFNDGAECSVISSLYGCQLYAEFCYTGEYDEAALKRRFYECCGADADAFLGLTAFDYLPDDEVGDEVETKGSSKRSKDLLYEDPLMPLFEKDFEGVDLAGYYRPFIELYNGYAQKYPEYELLFRYAAELATLVSKKCEWRIAAPAAVRAKDRAKARELIATALELKAETERFADVWRALWHKYNKPFGFELNDIRIGGVAARFATAAERLRQFADGEIDDIEELSCEKLPFSKNVEGAPKGCVRKQTWHSVASVDTIGGYTCLRA